MGRDGLPSKEAAVGDVVFAFSGLARNAQFRDTLEAAGFRDVVVDYRSPVPESDRIPEPAAGSEDLAPIARLLFAPQDIAVIGTK